MTDDNNPNNPNNQELEKAMKALSDAFLEKIPAAVQSMEDDLSAVALDCQNQDSWKSLYRRLHNMAGSAGMFNYPELGQRAKELELRTHELPILKDPEAKIDESSLPDLVQDYETFLSWVRQEYVKNQCKVSGTGTTPSSSHTKIP